LKLGFYSLSFSADLEQGPQLETFQLLQCVQDCLAQVLKIYSTYMSSDLDGQVYRPTEEPEEEPNMTTTEVEPTENCCGYVDATGLIGNYPVRLIHMCLFENDAFAFYTHKSTF